MHVIVHKSQILYDSEYCQQLLLVIVIVLMEAESKLVFFLKKIGKQSNDAFQKQKIASKRTHRTGKLLSQQGQQDNIFSDEGLNKDYKITLKRRILKNNSNQLYQSLQSRTGASQSQRENDEIVKMMAKNDVEKQSTRQFIVDTNKIEERNRLYRIPISNNKLKQKCNRNLISFVKIPNIEEQANSTVSQNFNTFQQFKHFMSKLSDESQLTNSQNQNMAFMMNSNRKCSIVPALKPTTFKLKSQSHHDPNLNMIRFEHYILTKKPKLKNQKCLIVNSKKQQLASHIISRYKMKHRYNKQDDRLKTLEDDSINYISQIKVQNDRELQSVNHLLKISRARKEKEIFSHRNHHSHQSKYQKNISLFANGHNQEGIYEQKLKSYRQLIFVVNLAHKVYDPLVILDSATIKHEKTTIFKPTYFIGHGNNSMLLRSLMKRRVWWDQVKQVQKANFVWTQLKISSIFSNQNQFVVTSSDGKKVDNKDDNLFLSEAKIQKQSEIQYEKHQKSIDKLTYNNLSESNKLSNQKITPINIPKGLIFKAPFAVQNYQKILTKTDSKRYKKIIEKCPKEDSFDQRLKYFPKDYFTIKNSMEGMQVHNHFQFNHYLGNKKSLFYHMQLYYRLVNKPINSAFPITFHIKLGQNDPQFRKFLEEYQRIGKEEKSLKNIWILKPGQNSNRGCGITVIKELRQLKRTFKKRQKHKNGELKTYILQKYIQNPLLYCQRKFDIRHYMIISGLHGRFRAYWYGEGYIRTSSEIFNLNDVNDQMIHLTNDAIQKQSEDYGLHQQGNKISYNQLQKYFNKEMPEINFDFCNIFTKMRNLARDSILATYLSIDPNKRLHNFEIFGLDFMIDRNMNVMLIEVNTNPCLQLSSNVLERIIPTMLEQTLRVTLDPLFPPPVHYSNNTKYLAPDCNLQKLQMELIFDSERDGEELLKLYQLHEKEYNDMMSILSGSENELDDVYDNEGVEIQYQTLIPQ